MARKKVKEAPIEEVGIDKVEQFVQTYFKQIIITAGVVIGVFIISYSVFMMMQNSKANKVNLLTELEYMIYDNNTLQEYIGLGSSLPEVKDYTFLRAAEIQVGFGNNATAINEAKLVKGGFTELAAGLEADLGSEININQYIANGKMKPLWYYRLVVESTPEERAANIELFRAAYPDDSLLKLVENWSN